MRRRNIPPPMVECANAIAPVAGNIFGFTIATTATPPSPTATANKKLRHTRSPPAHNWVCRRSGHMPGSIPGGESRRRVTVLSSELAGRGSSWADRPCRVAGRATPAAPAARRRSGAYCGGSNSTVAPREVDDSCNSNMPPGGVSAGTSNDNPTGTVAPGLTLVSNISVNSVAAGSAL